MGVCLVRQRLRKYVDCHEDCVPTDGGRSIFVAFFLFIHILTALLPGTTYLSWNCDKDAVRKWKERPAENWSSGCGARRFVPVPREPLYVWTAFFKIFPLMFCTKSGGDMAKIASSLLFCVTASNVFAIIFKCQHTSRPARGAGLTTGSSPLFRTGGRFAREG